MGNSPSVFIERMISQTDNEEIFGPLLDGDPLFQPIGLETDIAIAETTLRVYHSSASNIIGCGIYFTRVSPLPTGAVDGYRYIMDAYSRGYGLSINMNPGDSYPSDEWLRVGISTGGGSIENQILFTVSSDIQHLVSIDAPGVLPPGSVCQFKLRLEIETSKIKTPAPIALGVNIKYQF